jgi:hypothetical protein
MAMFKRSRRYFLQSGHIKNTPTERPSNGSKPIPLHIRKENVVLISRALVAPPYLANDAVFACAVWTFVLVVGETSEVKRIREFSHEMTKDLGPYR